MLKFYFPNTIKSEINKEEGVDGHLNPKTENAVISFHKSRGISTYGHVGPITWSYLFNK